MALKSQVPSGKRGKAGGIRFADTPGEVLAIGLLVAHLAAVLGGVRGGEQKPRRGLGCASLVEAEAHRLDA